MTDITLRSVLHGLVLAYFIMLSGNDLLYVWYCMTSGVAKVGHTGAHTLPTWPCAPPR